jgi:hypothetical protein
MKRPVFAKRVMQLRRRENELRYFRLTHVSDHQRPIAVIRLLAEETTQSQVVIKCIFDIEGPEPLGIETNHLRGDGKSLCINVGVHRSSVVGYARIQLNHPRRLIYLSLFSRRVKNAVRVNSSSGH